LYAVEQVPEQGGWNGAGAEFWASAFPRCRKSRA